MKLLQSLALALLSTRSVAFLGPQAPLRSTSASSRRQQQQRRGIKMSAATTVEWKGSTLTDNRLAEEAAAIFLEPPFQFTPTSGGVNNVVLRVASAKDPSKEYVLRIYNNGNNRERIVWEHEILKQLNKQSLSFQVPKALPSLKAGETHVPLSNGAEATLFEVIPGGLPKLTCVENIGRCAGELSAVMQKLDVKLASPTPPYWDLYAVHHAVDRDSFFREMAGSDFDHVRAAADKAVEDIKEMEKSIEKYMDLPTTLIHGDLHYDNILVEDGQVTALLDFEFSAFDWRAMELAVCLSKYAGEKEAWNYFSSFITGWADYGYLTDREIEAIPDLINLRILSNVIYFVGRALAKEDDISSITTRIENYCARVDWVKANGDRLVGDIKAKLAAKAAQK